MNSPCLLNMLYIVKQQSYIDLKRTGVETLGNRKHFSWQSTNGKWISAWQSMNIYVFHGFLAFLCIMNQIFEEEHYFSVSCIVSYKLCEKCRLHTSLSVAVSSAPWTDWIIETSHIVSLIPYKVQHYLSRESSLRSSFEFLDAMEK